MSNQENQNEDLSALEAALSELRPRADRLDPRWPSRLAEEFANPRGTHVLLKHSPRDCDNPAGHEFLCIHCGSAAEVVGRTRRWAWPAAFSTMSAVAALLLVMLATRSSPQVAAVVEEQAKPVSVEKEQVPGDWLAVRNSPRPMPFPGANESSYLKLRNQVVRYGVESWKSPVSSVATEVRAAEAPLNYREQLDRLLKETNHAG